MVERRLDGEANLYTRREIDMFVVNLSQKFELWDVKLNNIHEQVKAINGRVSANATDVKALKSWRDRIVGALAVITIVVLPMIAFLVKLWFG